MASPKWLRWLGQSIYIVCLLLLITSAQADQEKRVRLAGAHWCPYSCDYAPFPGFVTQYITALLEKQGYVVSVDIMNWPEAIAKARSGEYDGLITAVKNEVPDLLLTNIATDIYRSCFYTLNDSNWHYQNIASLDNTKLGVINNYAYGSPLDEWLSDSDRKEHIYTSQGKTPLRNLIDRLQAREIDTFIQDRYVLSHFLHRSQQLNPIIKEAGCLKESPFYLAFNPGFRHADTLVSYLNNEIDSDKNRQLKHYFKLRYGLGKYF